MGVTPSKTATARMTGKTVVLMIRHPRLRRATVKAAKPPAKVGWRVGKVVASRTAGRKVGKARDRVGTARDRVGTARDQARDQMGKARDQIGRAGAAGKTLGSLIVVYGPMAAEVFGLIETPKPKRRAPAFAAGAVVGAGALYALNRKNSD